MTLQSHTDTYLALMVSSVVDPAANYFADQVSFDMETATLTKLLNQRELENEIYLLNMHVGSQ